MSKTVQEFYLAYYGRPADPKGLAFWQQTLSENDNDFDAIVDAFGNSQESQDLFAGKTWHDAVSIIYNNILGRDADSGGLDFYVTRLQNGEFTIIDIARRILDGAKPGSLDRKVIDQLVEVADSVTMLLENDQMAYTRYNGIESVQPIKDLMKSMATLQSTALYLDHPESAAFQPSQILKQIESLLKDSYTGAGSIRELKKDFIASIDLRFDQPNDRVSSTADGDSVLVSSFENVRRYVDMAKTHGFTAIELDLNVPINRETGNLQLMTPRGTFNPDKSLPRDTWKIVSYAESLGLGTSLKLNIVDALTDDILIKDRVAPNFDVDLFFQSLTDYQMMIGQLAQHHGVDQLVIGFMNFGFDSSYQAKWKNLVDGIRSVYHGELAYETAYQVNDVVVWGLVDNVALTFQPNLGDARYGASEIVPLYLRHSDQSPWGTFNPYQTVLDIVQRYDSKDVMLYSISKSPVQPGLGETVNVHDILYKQNEILDLSRLDFDLLSARYSGFLEFFNNYLDDKIDAVQFWQFAPWADADWIRDTTDANGKAMNAYARGGYFLNYQPESLDILDDYFLHGWGANYLAFPGSNDRLPDLIANTNLQGFLI
jgi:hypothetical protein